MIGKRHFLAGLGAISTLPSATWARPRASFNKRGINWLTYTQGRHAAKRSGKPIFMVVHATWCPACNEYREVFFDKRVEKLSKNFECVLVDVDKHPTVASAYERDGGYVPRSMILESNGTHRVKATSGEREYKYYLDPSSPRALIRFLKANS